MCEDEDEEKEDEEEEEEEDDEEEEADVGWICTQKLLSMSKRWMDEMRLWKRAVLLVRPP